MFLDRKTASGHGDRKESGDIGYSELVTNTFKPSYLNRVSASVLEFIAWILETRDSDVFRWICSANTKHTAERLHRMGHVDNFYYLIADSDTFIIRN